MVQVHLPFPWIWKKSDKLKEKSKIALYGHVCVGPIYTKRQRLSQRDRSK